MSDIPNFPSKPVAQAMKAMVAKAPPPAPVIVDSLLDAMTDGNEYASILDRVPRPDLNLGDEIKRALAAIEQLRERPCLSYLGNVVKLGNGNSSIDVSDDLPFAEMVSAVPAAAKKVDVLLATMGGSGQQVARFVNCLRSRFDEVDFLIPSFCMSAGTLFALSGNRIWMTERACLGPIDPQVPTAGGRFVPAQALLLLVDQLRRQGEAAQQQGQPIPWTAIRIIDAIDKKELGEAITASAYADDMAKQFLIDYKFNGWTIRQSSGTPVTSEYKAQRASEIARDLVSHEKWKNHGHSISRAVLWNELRLKIDHPDDPLNRGMVRAWALCNWIFDKTSLLKVMLSQNYGFIRLTQEPSKTQP